MPPVIWLTLSLWSLVAWPLESRSGLFRSIQCWSVWMEQDSWMASIYQRVLWQSSWPPSMLPWYVTGIASSWGHLYVWQSEVLWPVLLRSFAVTVHQTMGSSLKEVNDVSTSLFFSSLDLFILLMLGMKWIKVKAKMSSNGFKVFACSGWLCFLPLSFALKLCLQLNVKEFGEIVAARGPYLVWRNQHGELSRPVPHDVYNSQSDTFVKVDEFVSLVREALSMGINKKLWQDPEHIKTEL